MIYSILADFVVALHLGYVAFVLVAQLLILIGIALRWQWVRNLRFRVIHFVMLAVVALEGAFNIFCPLTYLEYAFRSWADNKTFEAYDRVEQPAPEPAPEPEGDNRTFVGRLLGSILFLEGVPQQKLDRWYVVIGAGSLLVFLAFPPRRGSWSRIGLASIVLLWLGPLFLLGVVSELAINTPASAWSEQQIQRYCALVLGLGITLLGAAWALRERQARNDTVHNVCA